MPEATAEKVARVRRLLLETFERAGIDHARHAAGFSRWFVSHRGSLDETVCAFRAAGRQSDAADIYDILREVEVAVSRDLDRLINVDGRAQLMQAWNELLIDATAKVEAERRDEAMYSSYEPSDEDRAYDAAVRSITAENWRNE